jgi:hypothetical protein
VNLKDLSAPSVKSTKKRIRDPDLRRKSNRQKLMEATNNEMRHLTNAAEHRGDKDAISRARELTQYVAACLAIVQPYEPNPEGGFRKREGGDKEEFWEWLRHMKDLLALRLPYERPRLASITLREERPEDAEGYKTVYELRAFLMKKGLPVDHLDEQPLMLEHDLDDDAGARAGNGHATNGQ